MRTFPFVLFVLTLVVTGTDASLAGRFEGRVAGAFVKQPEGFVFQLSEDFSYIDGNENEWPVKAGEFTDGASIPSWAKSVVGGNFEGLYLHAAVVHDYYCCAKTRDFDATHLEFFNGLIDSGVSWWKANEMYLAVTVGGPKRWTADPSRDVPKPCLQYPAAEARTVFDTLDEEGQRLIIAKVVGMARTMATTDNKVLDVVDGKIIAAGSTEAKAHLASLAVAAENKFSQDLGKFGLFSPVAPAELEVFDEFIVPWRAGQIKELDIFNQASGLKFPVPTILDGKEFKPAQAESRSDNSLNLTPSLLLNRERVE